MIHPRQIIRDLRLLADHNEAEAARRGRGTEENNARVASYLQEDAAVLRDHADQLTEALEACSKRHGYQW